MIVTTKSTPWHVAEDDPASPVVATGAIVTPGIVIKVIGVGRENRGFVNVEVAAATADALWGTNLVRITKPVQGYIELTDIRKGP